jgi:hypothetical protein
MTSTIKKISLLIMLVIGLHQISFGGSASNTIVNDPLSIQDFSCGDYTVATKLGIDSEGQDYLVFYPETEKSFQIPIYALSAQDSFRYQGVFGLFDVRLMKKKGITKGSFQFKKFISVASMEETLARTAVKTSDDCQEEKVQ